jgi:hypothetical protein
MEKNSAETLIKWNKKGFVQRVKKMLEKCCNKQSFLFIAIFKAVFLCDM